MIDALALAITVVSVGAALVIVAALIARRYRRSACGPTLALLQAGLVLQAVLDVVALARGHHPREPATHVAYLVASLLVLPLAGFETRRDDGSWSAGLLVVALVVQAVLVIRMQTTWRSG